ncbi:ABC transporter ATP-binding protein [Sphingomonas sp. DBB INV C78]|uniref:ATP-binding cassette domain-containing protein n=1 Tax=Sphingomonas sp. DBB INV C78 TaxID=3349434 RepID=UPI0036D36EBD
MAESVATARGVTKRFAPSGPAALDGVDMDIVAGRMTGLVGPDGAGKTTLIRLLAGLLDADGGTIDVLGKPATEADRTMIGYMPQRFGLYEDLSVLENLTLYADLRGLPHDERQAQFDRLLEFTDLARFKPRLAGKLSGGMKQKLGLACALVRTPRLLLLDEPGVGVDPVSRRELWAMVQELAGEGIGVLWSTAYLDEAEKCDSVFLLNEGKLLHGGPPEALTDKVAGRIFRLAVPPEERRHLLEKMLDREDVTDGTIQGASLRIVMRDGAAPPHQPGVQAEPVDPRFEDAFVDLLGGGPPGTSRLAEAYRQIPESDQPAILAEGLTKRFGDFTAARDIRFSVPRGQIFGLLGPNGAGKSTTFKMLCGLLTPSAGNGRVAGHDLRTARADARQSLGYMAQKFSLYGDLSVQQNLDFFSGAYGLSGRERRDAIERVTDIFHLADYLDVNSGTMPLGYKQRLALACAVMHQPPVLFLDEPTSGVDPIVRREFWAHINGLVERGVTVLVTTHFMDEAEYCDRIALIYRAEEIAMGTPDELKAQAAQANGKDDPTMEDAFIALIESSDAAREAA